MSSRYGTPPPLHAPVPSKPSRIPDPPSTPGSPDGYQRFSSDRSPPVQNAPLQQPAYPYFQNTVPHQIPPHHQQQQQQQQHYQSHQGNMRSVPPTGPMQGNMYGAANAWGVNDVTAQFGMQLGQSAVAAGQDYVQKNFGVVSSAPFKHHFNVSNSYVLRKLQLVLFPWRHKPWTRRPRPVDPANPSSSTEWEPPREDLNSPDLYIPAMALVTYILISAFSAGVKGTFHPSEFSMAASRAIGVWFADVIIVWIATYLVAAPSTFPVIESAAWAGYKFVGVCLTLLAGLLTSSRWIYVTLFLYAFAANGFFLLRGLRPLLLADPSSTQYTGGQGRQRRIMFLFFEAMVQMLYMYWLVRI